ncbi:MAG: cytochrome c maturation protein CcmE, partial [Acidobacteriota bacterium]
MSKERMRRRVLALSALIISGGVLAFLAFGGIGDNLVYYWSPSELKASGAEAQGASIRLGGVVEPGSVVRSPDGLKLEFAVTDGENSVPISTTSVPPAMFRECIGVVVEGTVDKNETFETRRLLVKHDNQYQAPEEGEDLDMQEMMKSMQFAES